MRHYSVIDVETTGALPGGERITEIAIYRFDGDKVVDKFESLVNPEVQIPPFIVRLTGITDDMVADAPVFSEIADHVEAIFDDAVFVAHNVSFDFGMVRSEFERIGITFSKNRLCTVKLSRKILPGHPSYSLGKLCKSLGIILTNRHRASGDALATVELFGQILEADAEQVEEALFNDLGVKGMHPKFDKAILNEIPEAPGLFYFYDELEQLLYQGYGENISRRVFSLLRNKSSEKMKEMHTRTMTVTFELTGSALIAKLKAAADISQQKPPYNKGMQQPTLRYGIMADYDTQGFIELRVGKVVPDDQVQVRFVSPDSAQIALKEAVRNYKLCPSLAGEAKAASALCVYHVSRQCAGACVSEVDPESYNAMVQEAVQEMRQQFQNFLVIDKGRHKEERSIILVEEGNRCKYTFIDEDAMTSTETILDHITNTVEHPLSVAHIRKYLENNKVEKILYLARESSNS